MAIRGNLKDYWQGLTIGRVFRDPLTWSGFACLELVSICIWSYQRSNYGCQSRLLSVPFCIDFLGSSNEKEKLNGVQLLSIGLAMIGVSRLAWELDDFPYIATGIALTWGT